MDKKESSQHNRALNKIGVLGVIFGLLGLGYSGTFFKDYVGVGATIDWSRFDPRFPEVQPAFWIMYVLWDMLHICTFLLSLQFIQMSTRNYVLYAANMLVIALLGMVGLLYNGNVQDGMVGTIMHVNAVMSFGALPQLLILFPIWSTIQVARIANAQSNQAL